MLGGRVFGRWVSPASGAAANVVLCLRRLRSLRISSLFRLVALPLLLGNLLDLRGLCGLRLDLVRVGARAWLGLRARARARARSELG